MISPTAATKPLDLDLSRVGQALVQHLRDGLPADLVGLPVELAAPASGPQGVSPGIEIRALGVKVAPQFKNPYASLPGQAPSPSARVALELHLHLHPRCPDPLLQLRLLGWLLQTVLERPTMGLPPIATEATAPPAASTLPEHVHLTVIDEPHGGAPPPVQPGLFVNVRSIHASFALHASPALMGEAHATPVHAAFHAQ